MSKAKPKRRPWWAITHSRDAKGKTYHYLNVAAKGKNERPIVVTTRALDLERIGAFAMCIECRSNSCEHARFVAECVTMGVTSIGEERHRDSAPPPSDPPPDLEQWRGIDDGE